MATIPQQWRQKACWYFLTQTERIRKRMELLLQLSPRSILGIIFSIGNGGTSSSQLIQGQCKGKVGKGRDGFQWLRVQGQINLTPYSYLLTLGIGLCLVYQAIPACISTSYPDVGEYKGQTWLSPPAAYPSTMEYEANEGSLQPRHHVYAVDYYSSMLARVIHLYQGPSTRASTTGMNDEPTNKQE